MRAERHSGNVRAALAVAALVAVGAVVAWSWSAPPLPPPAPGAAAQSAALGDAALAVANIAGTAAAADPALGVAAEGPERTFVARAPGDGTSRTGVTGKVLDRLGAPLPGFSVVLQCTHRRAFSSRQTLETEFAQRGDAAAVTLATLVARTDDAGVFTFEGLVAGSYRCNVIGHETAAEKFALADGEVHEVTLQCTLVALTGTLFRNSAMVKDCFAAFDDGKTRRATQMPDDQGLIRSFAAPGRHQVRVHLMRGVHQGPGWGPCLGSHVLIVPGDVGTMQWRLETGGTEMVFAVEDRDGLAIGAFTVEIEGTGACDNESGRYVLTAAPGRSATITALPPGRWRASVVGEDFRAEPRELVTGTSGPRETVTFVAMRAAPVRMILHPRAQFFAIPIAEEMPALQYDGGCVPCDTSIPTAVTAAAPAFDYRSVPLGSVKLSFADRVEGGELVPLPFEPIAAMTIDVAAGSANRIDVDVEPRPYADLCAYDDKGRAAGDTKLTVWDGDRRVRNRDGTTSARWTGPLPHGDYRVVVEQKGARREHALRVDRPHVRERYQL